MTNPDGTVESAPTISLNHMDDVKPLDGSVAAASLYYATIYPGPDQPLSPVLGGLLKQLQDRLGMPLVLVIQHGPDPRALWEELDRVVTRAFIRSRDHFPKGQPVAVLIESGGGSARDAYQLARFLMTRCGSFTAVVPSWAKSAATLLALGAESIILGPHGELGPLDAQVEDPDRESTHSALDDVQALERLHAFGLDSFDELMFLLVGRTNKKIDWAIPNALKFSSDMLRPLLEHVDVIHYTELSRILKVGEEYARRLLQRSGRFSPYEAEVIARRLVEGYPEHGFVIDIEEAEGIAGIGLQIQRPDDDLADLLDEIWDALHGNTAIGMFKEVEDAAQQS